MSDKIAESALDQLFRDARTHNGWTDEPVGEDLLRQLWDLVKMAPTSANCSPARLVFVTSDAAKEKLKPCLMEGNVAKTMAAPVTVIIGQDMEFYEKLPELFPHTDAKAWFAGNDDLIASTAFRNATLQGGYLIMAARALGLDCGPMSGFDVAKVDAAFFAGTKVTANFLCNIGHGTTEDLFPRSPRFTFDDACRVV
ncbi:MAG TPA: malonic semialdehyde reductase [Rhodospirillaceae bacterium]|nr:malonic semialdehyde reductase [Magnetovibrio sp.]HBT43764.1 malonic semialdehyde reductase [Rhodospirillaceae bacterium]HCS72152.1 malonic semialdehyde reductase [Rhodospirillaceae bacterium]|tara:strand:- start:212 stop:802 length:591 start_codon:yes stop_codon:yes gene_type:complete